MWQSECVRYYGIQPGHSTELLWDLNESREKAYADSIAPIAPGSNNDVPFGSDGASALHALQSSKRHGSSDKRFLALNDSTPSHVVAEISLVKGVEYIRDQKFKAGWIPLAIIVVPDSSLGDSVVYPKLKMRGGTSWLFVRHGHGTTWAASLVRLVGTTIYQDSLAITAGSDSLPPAPAARFVWQANDDIIWGTCAGNCCRIAKSKAATL